MLEIKNLKADVHGTRILNGVNLSIKPGEVHAIMGPNGAGKSTLSYTLAGRDNYVVKEGDVTLDGKSILGLEAEERAREGVFLAFQYPVEIPGVTNNAFLKEAVNALRKHKGEEELDAMAFIKMVRAKTKELGIADDMLKRPVNTGFSGGEKKRNDILQMALLEPKFAILDETDSGLDIDALRIVSEGVNAMRSPDRAMLVITHYTRLLEYIKPDFVHVLAKGQIVKSGGYDLAHELEKTGYAEFGVDEAAA